MKISDIQIDGFGVWRDLSLDGLNDQVTVFYGPNEAGKTTLMQFVRAVLYGFSEDRRSRYLPPVTGGRPGGSLTVLGSRGRFTISRIGDRGDLAGIGKVQVQTGSGGGTQGPHLLSMMLAGVDEPIFNNVFAVGLREIQELGTLSGTAAASHLFGLTAGLDRVSLVDVMRQLKTDRARIAGEGEEPSELAALLVQRDRLLREVEKHQSSTDRWLQLVQQQVSLKSDTKSVEEEIAGLEHRLKIIELAERIRQPWRERRTVLAELVTLEPLPDIAPDAVTRWDDLSDQLDEQTKKCDELKKDWLRLRDEMRALPLNEGLRRNGCRVEAVCEQENWLKAIQEQIQWLQSEVTSIETSLIAEREELGLGESVALDDLPTLRERAERELKGLAKRLKDAQERVERSREEVANVHQSSKHVSERLVSALAELGEDDLTTALEKAGQRVSLLRRRIQIEDRRQQLTRHRGELDAEGLSLAEEQVLPPRALSGIGAIFIVGVVLLLVAFNSSSFGLTEGGAWFSGLVGFGCICGSVLVKFLLENVAAGRMEVCDDEVERLNREIRRTKEERDEVDAQLPSGTGAMAARLQEAERLLNRLEELVPLDAQRSESSRTDETSQSRARQAAAELKDVRAMWRDALLAMGLPDVLTPSHIKRLLSRVDDIARMQEQLGSRRRELEQRTAELVALSTRVNRLSEELGVSQNGRHASEQLKAIIKLHGEQRAVIQKRDELARQAKDIKEEYRKEAKQQRRIEKIRRELLDESNVRTEEALRFADERINRHHELTERRNELTTQIAAITAGCALPEIERELENGDSISLDSRFEEMTEHVADAETRLKDLYQQAGRLGEQIKAAEGDRSLRVAQVRLSCVQKQIAKVVERWRVLAATGVILESVRHIYETERQPATLSDASRYLEEMTDGRYRRIWTPLDEDTLLVDDAEGKPLRVEVLSAGTREQVFLAIRLALVGMYSRRGADLPLILDDVLVNCDARRTHAAARVLSKFAAEGHQVLVFTCHQHIVKIFQSLEADVRRLPVRESLEEIFELPAPAPVVEIEEPEPEPETVSFTVAADEEIEEEEYIEEYEEEAEYEEYEEEELPAPAAPQADIEPFVPVAEVPIAPPPPPKPEPLQVVEEFVGDDEWEEETPFRVVGEEEPFAELMRVGGRK